MGFFSKIFHRKSQEEREMEAIFEAVNDLLNNDEAQVACLANFFGQQINSVPMNMLPDAIGEYGRDPRNPIICNGPLGEITYLSRLVIPLPQAIDPMRVTFHRLGCCKINNNILDEYEIISYDGYLHDILYVDMYHKTKSKLCPQGYRLENRCVGFRGINYRNETFPYNQYQSVKNCVKKMIGFPAFDTSLKMLDLEQADRTIKFCNQFAPGAVSWWN